MERIQTGRITVCRGLETSVSGNFETHQVSCRRTWIAVLVDYGDSHIGKILSVSILSVYINNPSFLSERLVMLFGAYCVIILPYIYQGIRNGMRAVNMPMLLEAAEMLGASRLYAFFRVIVPNILSAIIVSSLLAVGIIFGDYVLVRNLAGSSFPNVQIFLYQTMKSDSMKASAVFVVIMAMTFLIAAIVLFLKSRDGHERSKRKVKE